MARPALLDPKNFAPDTGSKFKEGFVRVDQSFYTVNQDKAYEGQQQRAPYTALLLCVTRLNDELEVQMGDDDETPVTEKLYFSFGGKSLTQIHPAKGSGPEDEEPEDLGTEVDIEGNTVTLIKEDFRLNPKSGLAYLSASLTKIGYTPEHMTRMWAPDFKGVVFHMKTQLSDEKMTGADGVERPIPYKVADKFFPAKAGKSVAQPGKKGPGKETGSAAGSGSAGTSAGKNSEAEKLLDPILMTISETFDGQTVTRKALSTKVSSLLQSTAVDTKMHIPVLTLVKDNDWLAKHGQKYDYAFDADNGTVTFGQAA